MSGRAACGVECLLRGSAGTLLTHKLLLGLLLLAWNIGLMVMKPVSQALVSLVSAALLWVTVTSQTSVHWTHMSPLVWLVVAWEGDLHAQGPARVFAGACGFGCRYSRSPGQGEVQLPPPLSHWLFHGFRWPGSLVSQAAYYFPQLNSGLHFPQLFQNFI